jgi:type II restriction enzyme
LGGLIEEWFGVWAEKNNFNITDPKENGSSQEFPTLRRFYLLLHGT